jgi:hypothetical protein
VTLVGKVVSCAERAGNIDLQISDGTGVISITYFVDSVDSDVSAAIATGVCIKL